MERLTVKLSDIISPTLFDFHRAVKSGEYTHYWNKGGRGSTKSSVISIEIAKGLMNNPGTHAVVLRKVAANLSDSVGEQIGWAIEMLGVSHLWEQKVSPLKFTYLPTGQTILFRGADKPKKIKSIKVKKGYIRYVWYEEVDEFSGPEELRVINQSLMRGGSKFDVFYSYNPPRSSTNWVNTEVKVQAPRKDTFVFHSSYLGVPVEWLGEQFITEAEHLKEVSPERYNHEYMGEVTGTGGEVFQNVHLETITDEQIENFHNVKRGCDWGYAIDPFHYTVLHYDRKRKWLYIYFEYHKVRLSNKKAAEVMAEENINNERIVADSSEPKSIAEVKSYGLRIVGAKKGPDSVDYGIKFLSEEVERIIVDPVRCPNTSRELLGYELPIDAHGNVKSEYPDKDNHSIDAIRYAMEDDMKFTASFKALK